MGIKMICRRCRQVGCMEDAALLLSLHKAWIDETAHLGDQALAEQLAV